MAYRIPRLHSPVNSWGFPVIFGDFWSFLEVVVENRCLPFAPVDFRRKPEPVPRPRVLSYVGRAPFASARLSMAAKRLLRPTGT